MVAIVEELGLRSALDSVIQKVQSCGPSKPELIRDAQENWHQTCKLIGDRYKACRINNFELSDDERVRRQQSKALRSIFQFCEEMPAHVTAGHNLVLYGPPGTGKDHLMTGMMFVACRMGFSIRWRSGMDLFAERRDSIQLERPEGDLIKEFCGADVLAISDPVPPWGKLTDGQAEFLFRIVDARYRRKKPVWVTANLEGGEEGENRIGMQVIDRLRDGALTVQCNWPSYRKAL